MRGGVGGGGGGGGEDETDRYSVSLPRANVVMQKLELSVATWYMREWRKLGDQEPRFC